jgi:ribosome-associated protein
MPAGGGREQPAREYSLATRKRTNTRRQTADGRGRKRAPRRGGGGRSSNKDESRALALAIAGAALEHKALNVQILDVRGKVDYSDYVVIMSGRSDRQVAALARNIEQTIESRGSRCLGVEGLPHASWLLMDYGDVIVHIFHEDTRGYYDLENLWIDAARVPPE